MLRKSSSPTSAHHSRGPDSWAPDLQRFMNKCPQNRQNPVKMTPQPDPKFAVAALPILVRFVPISADSHIDLERHPQVGGMGHPLAQLHHHFIDRVVRHFEHQFVMDLHDEPRR